MDTTNLIAWLPFDDSPTEDLCGNTWTAYGNPTVSDTNAISGNALQLAGDGANTYVECRDIALGGQDFTVSAWVYVNSSSHGYGRAFVLCSASGRPNSSTSNRISFQKTNFECENSTFGSAATNTLHHIEVDYQHSAGKVFGFIDGVLAGTRNVTYSAGVLNLIWFGRTEHTSGSNNWNGSIDEFQIYDGIALHTENFTPPTADDYDTTGIVNVMVDIERALSNDVTVTADLERNVTHVTMVEVLADLECNVLNSVTVLADLERNVSNATQVEVTADLQRNVLNSVTVLADLERNVDNIITEEIFADVQRRVTTREEFTTDIQRILTCTGELFADVELNITRDWLTRILPESSFLDEKFYASAKALDVEISKLFADTRQVLHLPRLDELDGLILDILADQLHVDNYDAINFDTATKKNLIRRSIAWHRIKGTPGAVQMVLEDAFRALRIDEWFEYGGEPYYFRIYCRGYLSTPEQFGAYWRMLFDSKNVRSHLERVIVDLTEDEPIRLYTGVARFNCGQRRVKLRRPKDYVLNVDTGILKFVRGTRTVGMKDWEPLYPLADGDWLRLYFNFPTGRDHPVLLRNPQDELTKGAIRDVGSNAADNVIFMNQFAEGTLGVDRAALIKGFTVTEKNDDKVLPKDGSLRLFWAFPKGNKHKMLLHNQKGNVTLGEIRRLGLSAANDDLLRNAYNQQTSGISHVALVKNFDLNDDNRDEKVGFEE